MAGSRCAAYRPRIIPGPRGLRAVPIRRVASLSQTAIWDTVVAVTATTRELEVLELHRQTAFTFDERCRMTHESAPDRSRGTRFSLAGCRGGNLAVIRDDVPDLAARELERLAAEEPPMFSPQAVPVHLEDFRALLGVDGSVVEHGLGLLWVFPAALTYVHDVHLVWSGTSEGHLLLARFADAMPESLVDRGFRRPTDIWEPWCVALVDDQVASIAETVRTGPGGAEVGVDTDVGLRGLGLGAAATAGWSTHPDLDRLRLFYSTTRENTSSRRLTDRLGLRFLGSTFAVS